MFLHLIIQNDRPPSQKQKQQQQQQNKERKYAYINTFYLQFVRKLMLSNGNVLKHFFSRRIISMLLEYLHNFTLITLVLKNMKIEFRK